VTRQTAVRRISRWVLVVLGAATGFLVLIEILSRVSNSREQSKRAGLGDRLYTEVSGSGEPIVLIAGLQGTTRYWGTGFDALAGDRRMIKIDLLGFGKSPWPDLDYTLDEHVEYLRRTLVAAGATRNVTIVAHSFGTIVAAAYADRFPDDIGHLFLLGAPVYVSETEARKRIWEMSSIAAAFSLEPILARETCLLMGAFRPLFRKIMPWMSDLPRRVAEDSVLHTWPSIRGAIQNVLLTQPIARFLGRVGSRTTFIHGTEDVVTPLARIQSVSHELGAEVVAISGDHQSYANGSDGKILEQIRLRSKR